MTRGRVALLALLPVLILVAGWLVGERAGSRSPASAKARLEARAAAVEARLAVLLAEAQSAALRARAGGTDTEGAGLQPLLAERLEGTGVVRGGSFESWTGTPAEAAEFDEPGHARVTVRGIRTSLLVRSEADASGRSGVASFVLEIRGSPLGAQQLLQESTGGIGARWDFTAANQPTAPKFEAGPPATLVVPWLVGRRPSGAALLFEEPAASALAARSRARARAFAGLTIVGLVVFALARRTGPVSGRRLVAVAVAVVASRAALLFGRTLEELLPRTTSSPSLYGRGDLFGLCASPAALFVTALGVTILLTACSRYVSHAATRGRRAPLLPLAAGALAGLAAIVALSGSLARDARVHVPRLDPSAPGTLLLALAAAVLLVGVAQAIATLVAPRFGLLGVALLLLPLSGLYLITAHRASDRVVEERLRSELAPLVLDQSARRRVALTASISEAAASPRVASALTHAPGGDDAFLAYQLWIESDLFHEGFASSIDVYDAEGSRRAHFGFAFPQVGGARETVARQTTPGRPPNVELETVPAGASHLRVIHAEAAVAGQGGVFAGHVVGHVLEDPGNLPFLPGNAPYLEALGGGDFATGRPTAEAPDYVLYDDDGGVVVSTVRQPPTATLALRAAAASGRSLDVDSGGDRYHALPLRDAGRLHLLMTPQPSMVDALGDAVRLILLGLAVLAVRSLGRTLTGSGGLAALLDIVRGSFSRKLLAAVLFSFVIPLVGLSIFLRAYIDRRGEASLADSAASVVGAAQRVVEDYQSVGEDDPTIPRLRINDQALWWLRRLVGQEIHVYEGGVLAATSKPEMFDSSLLQKRLPGEIDREVVRGGRPFVVRRERLGALPLSVAYARVDQPGGPRDAVIAVPLVIEQRAFARSVDRLVEMLLLLTTALVALLAVSASLIARSVAEPVRRLADASRRIAGGDYAMRLASSSRDEMGSLVRDFNRMAEALAGQRADLMQRRDYIEALLRHATTGVISTDAEGRVVTINPAAETLLHDPGGPPRPGQPLADELLSGEARQPLEVNLDGSDGTRRLRVVRVPLPDSGGGETGSLVLLDDVTSLMKSNQLEAWAEMARAIAHEIKNPLTPIQLSAEHVKRLLDDRGVLPSPEIDACLDTIVRKVRELRDISGAFSTYAKIPDLVLSRLDAAQFLRDVVAPYRAAPPPLVRIEERHDPTPPVVADRVILGRAIVNLIENALQAMPQGGTLGVASYSHDPGEVVLAITDTGQGLSPEARARLFEPYFSTKSSGTGLGLAIVRRVVLGHGGTIDVTSEPGRGTTMRIRLKTVAQG